MHALKEMALIIASGHDACGIEHTLIGHVRWTPKIGPAVKR
jgi:hypothetical protein